MSCLHAQTITEFHYDNNGDDVDEFVEVIVPSDGCTYTIEFVNGNNGAVYATVPVPACTAPVADICGTGASGCIFAIPQVGIQNGAPDGFALVQDCGGTIAVIEFLSYEGTLTATQGSADGLTSTNVGVSESSSTLVGSSITVTAGVGEVTPIATPGACPDVPLAITLTDFDANSVDGSVMLEWSTQNETSNDFFAIEHSYDGREFNELKTVAGAGTTSEKTSYEFLHENVVAGMHYYRLKQVDFDGLFSYTHVKSIDVKSSNTVSILPTLVSNEMKVRLSENLNNDTPINIFDITGQMVLETMINKDNNNMDIDVTALTSGTYFLILNIDGEISSTKFMKL